MLSLASQVVSKAIEQLRVVERALLASTGPWSALVVGRHFLAVDRHTRRVTAKATSEVLVVRLDEIGDLVLSVPFFLGLRSALPKARITVVVRHSAVNLVEMWPFVDRVVPARTFRVLRFLIRIPYCLLFVVKTLGRGTFDLAIVPRFGPDYYDASYIAYFCGANVRIAYSERSSALRAEADRGKNKLFTDVIEASGVRHEVERNRDLVRVIFGCVAESCGDPKVWWSRSDDDYVEDLLCGLGVSRGSRVVAVAVGARQRKRQWPTVRYAQVCRMLVDEFGVKVVLVGSGEDTTAAASVRDLCGGAAVSIAGLTTLRQTSSVFGRAALFIGGDTGTVHLAGAVGIPRVVISCHPEGGADGHENSPKRFGPWNGAYRVLRPRAARPPCRDGCSARVAHCILGVGVDAVALAARQLLQVDGWARA